LYRHDPFVPSRGLATVVAIVLIQSYHPPGAAGIPVAAWIMTIFSRRFLRAGGFGDLGLFQRVFWALLVFVAVVVLLLLVTPYLADYAAMCAALFAILFALGFCTARTAGFGFWAFLTILGVSTFVSLNPQVPVPSITIMNSFLGRCRAQRHGGFYLSGDAGGISCLLRRTGE
jgi:hypothetical protein